MRLSHVLTALAVAGIMPDGVWAQTLPPPSVHEVSYGWGGETRQVFTRVVNTETHVWTVGDGGLIRHAVDPQGDDWEYQSPPPGATQTLLDVYFLPDGLTGWACGVGGHVLKTVNGGATWQDQASGLLNQLTPAEPGTYWRVRFNKGHSERHDEVGFTLGLWSFLRWDGSAWAPVSLEDEFGGSLNIAEYEFYALDILVHPQDPSIWIGIAAGQKWSSAGSGAGKVGQVFYTNSSAQYSHGVRWARVFQTFDTIGFFDDPWDFEFEPNPAQFQNAVGYLCGGSGFTSGFVYRCTQSGLSWNPTPELSGLNPPPGGAVNTIYGISVLDADHAVAVSYGGLIWYRANGVWSLEAPEAGCGICANCPAPCKFSAPLAGAHSASGETFVVGSFGFVKSSPDGWTNVVNNLNTASSDNQTEQLRLMGVHFLDDMHGFAVGANRAIASLDSSSGVLELDLTFGGPSYLGATPPLLAIDFNTNGSVGVAVGPGGDFRLPGGSVTQALSCYSQDGGQTWTPSNIPALLAGLAITDARLEGVCWAPGLNAFLAAGSYKDATGTDRPLVLGSSNGVNWSNANVGAGAILPGTILTGVDFGPAQVGFCVGYNGTSARAYKIDFTTPLNPISSISPATGQPLRAVATNGTVTYAVGDQEEVYRYTGSGSMTLFDPPDLIPGGASKLDLISVAVAPEADFVLIGVEQRQEELLSPGLGKLLLYDGTSWHTPRAVTNKDVCSIHLLSADSGWLLSRSDDLDPEFGMVADSLLLRFAGPQ